MILSGVRILSFTTGIAGPNAGRILASLGADVIKVESTNGGIDAFRYFGAGDDLNSSARFAEANLGVKSVTANLKHPDGSALVRRLAAQCDVVLENYRPAVLERLGLGYDDLRMARPDVIVVKMPGLGSTGPLHRYGTWGALLTAYSGLTWLWNQPDATVPVGNQGVYPDYLSAVLAPMVLVSALIRREATGEGCLIDLAQSEATAFCALPISFLDVTVNGTDPKPVGNRSRDGEVQGVYRCLGDDAWCVIRLENDDQWNALWALIEGAPSPSAPPFPGLAAARDHHDAVDHLISDWTASRTPRAAMAELQAHGIPAGEVASGSDLLTDPQLGRGGFIRRFDQPGIGEMVVPGLPLEVAPPVLQEPPPAAALGEHNEQIFKGLVGLSDDEYDALLEGGVLA
jgi:benzylsuccinate CoA-transferase BbsF subunit